MFGVAMGIEAFYQRHWWLILALIGSCSSIVFRRRATLLAEAGTMTGAALA
jgi:hypothetical protein